MYTGHYKLSERPFETRSSDFLWLGEKHREILTKLEFALRDGKSFAVLVGEEGTGKTTLIRALLENLGPEFLASRIAEPAPDTLEFLKRIGGGFDLAQDFSGEEEFLMRFKKFLREAHRNNKRVLLIVDEAQKLTDHLLEQIRLLSNIELPGKKLIQIFLVGRNSLYENLRSRSCRGLSERIELHLCLPPLSKGETAEYIRHRMKAAGGQSEIFTEKTLRKIEKISSGNPRIINRICDRALLKGYAQTLQTISPKIIKECRKELLPRSPLLIFSRIFGRVGSFAGGLRRKIDRSNRYIKPRKRFGGTRSAWSSTPIRWSLASGTLVLLIALFLPAIGNMPASDWFRSLLPKTDPGDEEGRIFRYSVEEPKRLEAPDWPQRKAAPGPAYGSVGNQARLKAAAPDVLPLTAPAAPLQRPETKKAEEKPAPSDISSPPMETRLAEIEPNRIETEVLSYFHRVQWRGETLSLIAEWYTGSAFNWKDIAEANPGIDPHRIHIGDEIFIPLHLLKVPSQMPSGYLSSAPR